MFSDISLSGVHAFFTKVIDELRDKGEAELKAVGNDVKTAWAAEKNDILTQVSAASPDVQAAVQHALSLIEQVLLNTLAAHGL